MKPSRSLNETLDTVEAETIGVKDDRPAGVAYMVGRLDRALHRQFRRILTPLGLTLGQYTALSVFYSCGRLSNAKLAERIMVSPQAANEQIKVMEKKGWIERRPDPNHGRVININLTKEGMRLLARCHKAVAVMERGMLEDLPEKEIIVLHQQLRNAVKRLNEL